MKLKVILQTSLVAVMLFIVCSAHAAPDATPHKVLGTNIELYYSISGEAVTINGRNFRGSGALVIPDTIQDKPVTAIAEGCFKSDEYITSIAIPDSVTYIGRDAFLHMQLLRSIDVSANNRCYASVGGVLYNKAMTELIICPKCVAPTSFSLSDLVNGTAVTPATIFSIPDGVRNIQPHAFDGCKFLKSVIIPNSVTNISAGAFAQCFSLKNVTIGNGVTYIGRSAFWLTPVSLHTEDDLGYLLSESTAFLVNAGDASGDVTIPSEVKGLPVKCAVLSVAPTGSVTTVSIPKTVTNFDFLSPNSLRSITVAPSNPRYASVEGILYNKAMTELIAFPSALVASHFAVPDSVTAIGKSAFKNCNSLKSVAIPNGVSSIGDSAFSYCDALESVSIPDSVTNIGNQAFEWCRSLKYVTIGKAVTNIGDHAFYCCRPLERVDIPDSVTMIGKSAFEECESLKSVTIGNGVTTIGDKAFLCCRSLCSVNIPASVVHIGDFAFSDCHALTRAIFEGDAPSGSSGCGDFIHAASGFTVYFYKGTTGFKTPKWRGYPSKMIPRPHVGEEGEQPGRGDAKDRAPHP
jgi:hypothetical protein